MERRPLTAMERLAGRTVHCAPSVWARVDAEARARGFSEPLVFARKLIEHALDSAERESRMEASARMRRGTLRGSPRTRRF